MKCLSLINDYEKGIEYGKFYEIISKYEDTYLIAIIDETTGTVAKEIINKESIILSSIESIENHLIVICKLFSEMENYIDIEKSVAYDNTKDAFLSLIGNMEFLK